jgi:hypothetical protein
MTHVHATEPSTTAAQRCSCGGAMDRDGECANCRRKRLALGSAHGGPAKRHAYSRARVRSNHDFASVGVTSRSANGGGGDAPDGAAEPATPETDAATAPTATETAPAAAPVEAPEGAQPETEVEAEAETPTPSLSWTFVKSHTWDALWYFGGEHPSGFSTTVLLRADGYGDPTALTWTITRGSDKVAFVGAPTGPEVHVTSRAGSARADDVAIEVRESAAASHEDTVTVRKPHRLIQRFVRHYANCPPAFPTCPATCPAHWTEIGYRVVDNVGGTIVGATVNEHFPSAKTNDQTNDWVSPASFATVPVWPNTDGTFIDYWWIACGTPSPVNPGDPHDNDSVDRLQHEFYVGSRTSGRGVRVQTHTAHRYLGHTVHENIRTPAP